MVKAVTLGAEGLSGHHHPAVEERVYSTSPMTLQAGGTLNT